MSERNETSERIAAGGAPRGRRGATVTVTVTGSRFTVSRSGTVAAVAAPWHWHWQPEPGLPVTVDCRRAAPGPVPAAA